VNITRYYIFGFWGPRRETPEALACRFNRLIDRLALIDSAFSNWFWFGGKKPPVSFASIRNQLAAQIAMAVIRGDDGEPEPISGYRFGLLNSLEDTPRLLDLSVHAGSWYISQSIYSNTIDLGTDWPLPPDPAIVTYRIFKPALLALAETFETAFCAAFPNDLMKFWLLEQKFRPGWINYVAPRFAPLVTPPRSAIVEYRPDGGLLMSATDETFVTSNPQHLAVARDIETALAPLNALPWPPDAERDQA
jgi:hypothetical protein